MCMYVFKCVCVFAGMQECVWMCVCGWVCVCGVRGGEWLLLVCVGLLGVGNGALLGGRCADVGVAVAFVGGGPSFFGVSQPPGLLLTNSSLLI